MAYPETKDYSKVWKKFGNSLALTKEAKETLRVKIHERYNLDPSQVRLIWHEGRYSVCLFRECGRAIWLEFWVTTPWTPISLETFLSHIIKDIDTLLVEKLEEVF